jgi:SAM-dependent methyltransferase
MTGQDEAELRARALSFGSVAAEYAALRPGYPADAVAFLVGDGGRRVLDVGAGTGLLTEVVLDAGHDVTAVDPSPEMLAELVARLPAVTAAVGSAEALPVDDASVDAVVAGQAAHWFDPAPAAREIRRVLRPGGVLGLIWNTRDERTPWVGALGELISAEARGHEADQGVVDRFAEELPAQVDVFESGIVQPVTPENVVAGIATRSYVALMDDVRRAAFLAGVRGLLDEHPDTRGRELLELPYVTRAYRLTPS